MISAVVAVTGADRAVPAARAIRERDLNETMLIGVGEVYVRR